MYSHVKRSLFALGGDTINTCDISRRLAVGTRCRPTCEKMNLNHRGFCGDGVPAEEHRLREQGGINDDQQVAEEHPLVVRGCSSRACARVVDIQRDDNKCCGICIGFQFRGSHSKECNKLHPEHIKIPIT